jgi:hypothetical protein
MGHGLTRMGRGSTTEGTERHRAAQSGTERHRAAQSGTERHRAAQSGVAHNVHESVEAWSTEDTESTERERARARPGRPCYVAWRGGRSTHGLPARARRASSAFRMRKLKMKDDGPECSPPRSVLNRLTSHTHVYLYLKPSLPCALWLISSHPCPSVPHPWLDSLLSVLLRALCGKRLQIRADFAARQAFRCPRTSPALRCRVASHLPQPGWRTGPREGVRGSCRAKRICTRR